MSLFFVPPDSALALPPTRLLVENPSLLFRDEILYLNLSVSVDDEEGLRELLKDGAILDLTTTLTVDRERSWWANAEVLAKNYSSVLRHDPLSRDFIIIIPHEDDFRELRDRNLTRLLHDSWKKISYPVTSYALLSYENEESYQLIFSISLRHTEVPPWLEKSLVFWSAEVVPPVKGTLAIPPAGPWSPSGPIAP